MADHETDDAKTPSLHKSSVCEIGLHSLCSNKRKAVGDEYEDQECGCECHCRNDEAMITEDPKS